VIVVADTGPIHYRVLIEAVDILHSLYGSVLVPQTVYEELNGSGAPEAFRAWMKHPSAWFQSRPDPISDPPLSEKLDPGERAAIALALSIPSDLLLIDDWAGRVEAERKHIKIRVSWVFWRKPNEWVRGICEKPRIKCSECQYRQFLPLTDEVIRWHLSGFDHAGEPFVAGTYPMLQDETCFFLTADFDKDGWSEDSRAFIQTCGAPA